MLTLRRRTIFTGVMTFALASAIAGCSSDETSTAPGVDPAVVGTWNATSFTVMGTDLIALGMGVTFVFNSNGTYVLSFTNDQAGLCDAGSNCTETGSYTASDTQIIFDAGTTDETILNYSISGTTMTLNATIDGTSIVVVLNKA